MSIKTRVPEWETADCDGIWDEPDPEAVVGDLGHSSDCLCAPAVIDAEINGRWRPVSEACLRLAKIMDPEEVS